MIGPATHRGAAIDGAKHCAAAASEREHREARGVVVACRGDCPGVGECDVAASLVAVEQVVAHAVGGGAVKGAKCEPIGTGGDGSTAAPDALNTQGMGVIAVSGQVGVVGYADVAACSIAAPLLAQSSAGGADTFDEAPAAAAADALREYRW